MLPSLHIFPSLEVYDEKRIFQVGLLLVVGLFITAGTRLITSLQKINNTAWWSIAGFLVLGFTSIWVNGHWYYGLQELSLYVLLLVFLFYTAKVYVQYPAQFNKGIVLILLGFGGFYALSFFVGYGMHWFIDYPLWPGERYQNPLFGFANMRFLNQVQVWTLPLFIIWANQSRAVRAAVGMRQAGKEGDRYYPSARRISVLTGYFFFFLAVFWWCLILRTASAGAILCLFVAPFIVLLLYKEKCHLYIKKYLYAFLFGVLLKFALFDLFAEGGIAKSYEKATGMGRLTRWGNMITDIAEKPLFGFGPMSFAKIGEGYHAAHPHNSVLQIGYEFGLPAMFIAVGLVLWGLYTWYRQTAVVEFDNLNLLGVPMLRDKAARDLFGGTTSSQHSQAFRWSPLKKWRSPDILRIGISTSLFAGLGYSLFSGVMVMPLSQLWMALIGGWALGILERRQEAGDSSRDKRLLFQQWLFRSIVIAAVVFLSYSMINDVPKLKQNQQHYINEYGGTYHPRFWQQGLRSFGAGGQDWIGGVTHLQPRSFSPERKMPSDRMKGKNLTGASL